jgi:hypothetical protein
VSRPGWAAFFSSNLAEPVDVVGGAPPGLDGRGPCACRCIYHVLPFCDEGFIQGEVSPPFKAQGLFPCRFDALHLAGRRPPPHGSRATEGRPPACEGEGLLLATGEEALCLGGRGLCPREDLEGATIAPACAGKRLHGGFVCLEGRGLHALNGTAPPALKGGCLPEAAIPLGPGYPD